MAKVSANYEVVYIIDPAQGEENTAALVAKFKTLAEQNGSAVEVEEWGSRKLAYPINYKTGASAVWRTRSRIRRRAFTRWFVLSPSPISRLSWTVSTRSRTASCVP